jgi:hypothetical protein
LGARHLKWPLRRRKIALLDMRTGINSDRNNAVLHRYRSELLFGENAELAPNGKYRFRFFIKVPSSEHVKQSSASWLIAYLQENNMAKDKGQPGKQKDRVSQFLRVNLFASVRKA